ncbi:hypothetical protein ABBQ38_003484 [Trebouxia sp. C0009 RCD-2024]
MEGFPTGYPPWPVHRLDMMTSGVLIMAKKQSAAGPLAGQFSNRTAQKSYLAIVSGVPKTDSFFVDTPIGRHPTEKIARAVVPDGDAAHTDFIVVSCNQDASLTGFVPGLVATEAMYKDRGAALVVAMPRTGRTHQIRVHLADAGHAIIGDEVYGVQGPWIGRQALHAASLRLKHPGTGKAFHLIAPLPPDILEALQMLDIQAPDPEKLQTLL